MMEVGALLVGRIENRPGKAFVKRGDEKGNFAFGGSTIVLITEKNAVKPDEDILNNSVKELKQKYSWEKRSENPFRGFSFCG